MRTTRICTLAVLTTAALAVATPSLAGGGDHGAACPAYDVGDSSEIALLDSCIGPISATAQAGSTITVRNDGQQAHTYTALDDSLDSGVLQPGQSATVELPGTPGTIRVLCTLHAGPTGLGMAGTITLSAPADASILPVSWGASGMALAGGLILGSGAMATVHRRRQGHVR